MQEQVLMEGITNQLSKKGFATKNGHGVLTNKRFIYCKHSLAKTLAIGIWINLTKGQYEYDIPLEEIAGVEIGRHMLGQALTINKKDGAIMKYGIAKPLDWKIAWDNALSQELPAKEPEPEETTACRNFCPECGAKLVGNGKFCSNCGAKV